jgi:hypothetical protein
VLGARPRAGHGRHRVLRSNDRRQRALGTACFELSLPSAYFIAAAAAILGIALTWRWKLLSGAGVDLAPSM